MYTYIPLLAIITGGLTAVIIGFVWYSPYVLGKLWLSFVQLSPESTAMTPTQKYFYALLGLGAGFATSWALWALSELIQLKSVVSVLELSFVVWIGFAIPPLLSIVLWERKKFGSFFINAGYWLVTITVLAFIVSV